MANLLRAALAVLVALSGVCPVSAMDVRQNQAAKTPAVIVPIQFLAAPTGVAATPTALELGRVELASVGEQIYPAQTALPLQSLPVISALDPGGQTHEAPKTDARLAQSDLKSAAGAGVPEGAVFDGGKTSWRKRAGEAVEMAPVVLAAHFVSLFPNALTQGTPVHSLVMGALWAGASEGMAGMLSDARRTVVGGWQASHDQKYRTDYNTGQMRDIRGRKYGSDRYEEYAPGKVSAGERSLAALVSGGMGLLWVGADLKNAVAYAATMGLLSVVAAIIRSRRPPAASPQSPEDAAHAARFNVSLAVPPAPAVAFA